VSQPGLQGKSHDIPKRLIWVAWLKVKSNGGAAGADGVTIEQFESRLADNLYRLWNRMSSGSYFPGPVRAVEIPKKGGVRVLGIPNVRTRKSCERAWQVAGVAGSRTDAGDYPGSQPGCWGGVAQAWRSSGLAVQGRNRSSAGPVGGFPPLCPHWSR